MKRVLARLKQAKKARNDVAVLCGARTGDADWNGDGRYRCTTVLGYFVAGVPGLHLIGTGRVEKGVVVWTKAARDHLNRDARTGATRPRAVPPRWDRRDHSAPRPDGSRPDPFDGAGIAPLPVTVPCPREGCNTSSVVTAELYARFNDSRWTARERFLAGQRVEGWGVVE